MKGKHKRLHSEHVTIAECLLFICGLIETRNSDGYGTLNYTVQLCSTKLCSHSIHFSFMLVLHIPSNESKHMVCDIDVKFDVCILYSFSLVYFYSVVRLRAQMGKTNKRFELFKAMSEIYLLLLSL